MKLDQYGCPLSDIEQLVEYNAIMAVHVSKTIIRYRTEGCKTCLVLVEANENCMIWYANRIIDICKTYGIIG